MKQIEVVAAIIHDKEGRIFATQRGYGDYKDGWEFPGGKMEPGECGLVTSRSGSRRAIKGMAIEVTYRWTRRLSMRIVKNGDVHVSAPIGMPKRLVQAFIDEHREWIEKARKKTLERGTKRAEFFAQLPLGTKAQKAEARQRLEALLAPMIEKHTKEMEVSPQAITYKRMISRWGYCNVKNRSICFSLYLLLLPAWCVEHVVVHELCHLIEPSHNARFHALMDRYYPRWREARKTTIDIGGGRQ